MAVIVVAAGMAMPAGAIGFGAVEVESHLNQRLNAEIALSGADRRDIEANVQNTRDDSLIGPWSARDDVRIEVRHDSDGEASLHLESTGPVTAPALDIPIRVETANGVSIERTYTLLLNLPTATTTSKGTGTDEPPRKEPEQSTNQPTTYGPVRQGESAWTIARQVRPDGASIKHTMTALLEANPSAFRSGNIDRLRSGVRLEVPTAAEIHTMRSSPDRPTAAEPPKAEPASRGSSGHASAKGSPKNPDQAEAKDATDTDNGNDVPYLAVSAAIRSASAATAEEPPLARAASSSSTKEIGETISQVRRHMDQFSDRWADQQAETSRILDRLIKRVDNLSERVEDSRAGAPPTAASQTDTGASWGPPMLGGILGAIAGAVAGYGAGFRRRHAAGHAGATLSGDEPRSVPSSPDQSPKVESVLSPRPVDDSADPNTAEAADTPAGTDSSLTLHPIVDGGIEHDILASDDQSGHDALTTLADSCLHREMPEQCENIIRGIITDGTATTEDYALLLRALYEQHDKERFLQEAHERWSILAESPESRDAVAELGRQIAPGHDWGGPAQPVDIDHPQTRDAAARDESEELEFDLPDPDEYVPELVEPENGQDNADSGMIDDEDLPDLAAPGVNQSTDTGDRT